MNDIVIFQTEDDQIELSVSLKDDTVWLTQAQMVVLFDKTKQNISLHINNCFREGELDKSTTVKESLTVQREGKKQVKRKLVFYSLDVVISVGYRVKSKRGTQFRIWASKILKDYLVKGYAINQKRLNELEMEVQYLKSGINILSRTIGHQAKTLDEAKELASLINDFSKGLMLLDDYDHENLDARGLHKQEAVVIEYDEYMSIIDFMRRDFESDVFGREKDASFKSSIKQIYQSFDGTDLYPTLEEKATMLLYFVVKNHSFVDGNKRIAAVCFLYFMKKNGLLYKQGGDTIIDNNTLAALTLLIAGSKSKEVETVKHVVVSMLNRTE